MRVWIDQELCTGDGLCQELAEAVFEMHDDGLAYVCEGGRVLVGVGARARVHAGLEDRVRDAAERCPAECIFLDD
jgi:ferredoxin